jgi:hypothetical protein
MLFDKLVKLYVNEIVRLHRVPMSIVSNRDPWFTSQLWPRLSMSATFHP